MKGWIISITGYLQPRDTPTGLERLMLTLHGKYSRPSVMIPLPKPWNDDWENVAEQIYRVSNSVRRVPWIVVAAYSWGCGYGFTQLARQLHRRGLHINSAFLCDPVYHSDWLMLRWHAMFHSTPILNFRPRIVVPQNVGRVHWSRQYINWPRAHDILAKSPETTVFPPLVEDLAHEFMDESLAFHSMVADGVESIVSNRT